MTEWQGIYKRVLGHRLVFAADEYYLLAGRALPPASHYEGFPQHENGIGMARAFGGRSVGRRRRDVPAAAAVRRHGFFASVDAAPAEGYRAPRLPAAPAGRDERAGGRADRDLRRHRAGAPGGRRTRGRHRGAGRHATISSAATSAWPGC